MMSEASTFWAHFQRTKAGSSCEDGRALMGSGNAPRSGHGQAQRAACHSRRSWAAAPLVGPGVCGGGGSCQCLQSLVTLLFEATTEAARSFASEFQSTESGTVSSRGLTEHHRAPCSCRHRHTGGRPLHKARTCEHVRMRGIP